MYSECDTDYKTSNWLNFGGIILFFAAIIFISFVSPRAGFAITKFFIWAMASLIVGILAGFAVGRRM